MHAVLFDAPGGPDVLRWGPTADPAPPGPDEVLIEVVAAGVNNADLLQRRGAYSVPPGASPILGLEVSGIVRAAGADAPFAEGDAVCALLTGGGYAELVVVPAAQVLPLPAGVEPIEAAGLMEAACTVHSTLSTRARLAAGESLLVHGGGSGIGTFAIQWAAAVGARVLTTAGSQRKLDAAAALGADVLIDYRRQDFVAEVLAATEHRGVDVILDLVGADYVTRDLEALAADGRLMLIAGGGEARLPLALLMRRRATIGATALRSRPPEQKAAIVAAVGREVWPLIVAGRIRPVVDTVVPMREAADAHRLLEAGGTIGKVVLA